MHLSSVLYRKGKFFTVTGAEQKMDFNIKFIKPQLNVLVILKGRVFIMISHKNNFGTPFRTFLHQTFLSNPQKI